MRDEAFPVDRLSPPKPEPVLERGERTGPVRELDEYAPRRRGKLEPDESRPTNDGEGPECREEDEPEVEEEDDVGEDPVAHGGEAVGPSE